METPPGSPKGDDDGDYSYPEHRAVMRRLRGGVGSSSSGSGDTPPAGVTTSPKTVEPTTILRTNNSNSSSDSEMDTRESEVPKLPARKRKHVGDKPCALRDINPGISGEKSVVAAICARNACAKLEVIITSESGRKKCLVSTLEELVSVRTEIQEIFDELVLENAVLLGRLKEARDTAEAATMEKDKILEKLARMNAELKAKERELVALQPAKTSILDPKLRPKPMPKQTPKPKSKSKTAKKKAVRIMVTSDTTDVERTARGGPESDIYYSVQVDRLKEAI